MSDILDSSDIRTPSGPGAPDYPLADTVVASTTAQLKAIAEPIRHSILDLVLERAATTTELAVALGRPKGTVDHHLKVLANAGLVQVVRTRKVRAMTERYWGRTARTILHDFPVRDEPANASFLRDALVESVAMPADSCHHDFTTLRHARLDETRLEEFSQRLADLAIEFSAAPRGGDVVYGLLISLYPTNQPTLGPAASEQ